MSGSCIVGPWKGIADTVNLPLQQGSLLGFALQQQQGFYSSNNQDSTDSQIVRQTLGCEIEKKTDQKSRLKLSFMRRGKDEVPVISSIPWIQTRQCVRRPFPIPLSRHHSVIRICNFEDNLCPAISSYELEVEWRRRELPFHCTRSIKGVTIPSVDVINLCWV